MRGHIDIELRGFEIRGDVRIREQGPAIGIGFRARRAQGRNGQQAGACGSASEQEFAARNGMEMKWHARKDDR